MKKRSIGLTRSFMKLVGATLAFSFLISPNVHAEELDELVNSEDITAASEKIDNLNNQVDSLSDNCVDESVSDEISSISDGIDTLDDLFSAIASDYAKLRSKINQNKQDIISGLNRNVYAQNNISDSASYEDIISKINDIKYHGTLDIALDSKDKYTLESGYYDGGTIDVSALIEAARQEGKEEGYKEGKEDGYKEGLEAGKEYMMTKADNWIVVDRSASLAISPLITYRPFKSICIKCTNDSGLPLNGNDVVRIWVMSGNVAWGRVVKEKKVSEGDNLGGGWYRFDAPEGISIVQFVNNNNVSRDYVYHYSD